MIPPGRKRTAGSEFHGLPSSERRQGESLKEAVPLARSILTAYRLPGRARHPSVLDAVADFLIHLRLERGSSPNTLRAYQRDLRSFCRFLAQRGADPHATPPERIMRPDVRAYLGHLAAERSLRASSVVRHLACLRSFFRFLNEDERWRLAHDPTLGIPHPRVARRRPALLSPQEVGRILAASERISPYPRRDRCALQLLAETGCRVGELLRVRLGDVDLEEARILFRGLETPWRRVRLSPAAQSVLRRYLQEERPQLAAAGPLPHDAPHGALLLNCRSGPLSAASIERLFRRARVEAGIDRPVSLRALRASGPAHHAAGPFGRVRSGPRS